MFDIYRNKKILIFGNTGFVGTNMTLMLLKLGAQVIGYSDKEYHYFNYYNLEDKIKQSYGNIECDVDVQGLINFHKPDMIINLAAQAFVKSSYAYPKKTYETNILGTLNILEVLRDYNKPIVFLNVTSDKCYKNIEKEEGYIESDELNGIDIYSNSKSVAELITGSYRECFFNLNNYDRTHQILIATLRSGNIVGQGDFGEYRLFPDIMKNIFKGDELEIRSPESVRPWIYVFDTISGYLKVGEKLLERKKEFSGAWNFSSNYSDMLTVQQILNKLTATIYKPNYKIEISNQAEAGLLKLDSMKARERLNWKPLYSITDIINITLDWYKCWYKKSRSITYFQLDNYLKELNFVENN